MAETLKKYLNDSFVARWAALILIALAMFFAYMFVDVMHRSMKHYAQPALD